MARMSRAMRDRIRRATPERTNMTQVANDPIAIIPQLLAKVEPIVRDALSTRDGDNIGAISIEFKPDDDRTIAMDMYHIVVPIIDGTSADELKQVAEHLDMFCTFEGEQATFRVDGNDYNIGDGDDGGAVTFQKNALCIWLRTWGPRDE
jgi:hypothetical protein